MVTWLKLLPLHACLKDIYQNKINSGPIHLWCPLQINKIFPLINMELLSQYSAGDVFILCANAEKRSENVPGSTVSLDFLF